ncbi:MAG: UDP-N-acetylmuramoyl-L-alanyl-D-glutamate--2,6-diaminopimelate ligase [Maricaulaceae bacterium]
MKLGAALGGIPAPPGVADIDITGLSLDSRMIRPGEVFAALPGARVDGAAFAQAAVNAGAVAVLAARGVAVADAPVINVDDPARVLAQMAARVYGPQPSTVIAVTGTNGKSSTVEFLRQIWAVAGRRAGALGTLGLTLDNAREPLAHTTPDAITLHKTLAHAAESGVDHLAMEASSHGLVQRRLDGVRLSAVGFTNITQDHLDYHPDFEAYFDAKARLFEALAPRGAPAVIMVDDARGRAMAERADKAGLNVIPIGWSGTVWKLDEIEPGAAGQRLRLTIDGQAETVALPLPGEFQALNALTAAALAHADGVAVETILEALRGLSGVCGRLEPVGATPHGARVYVDYAHTPDGLDKALRALRPHTAARLIVVFGCGGDRDADKRPKMGAAAAKLADAVIITDDNPRSEEPSAIRAAIRAGAPNAREIADRAAAIDTAVGELEPGDVLLIAGKGHETGQIIGDTVIAFSDQETARAALAQSCG